MASESQTLAGEAKAVGGMEAHKAPTSWLHLPREFAASLLAITTVPISLGATHFPPWAVFVGWAGTYAAGGPKREVMRKMVPAMILGSVTAMVIVLLFNQAAKQWTGFQFTVAQMVILFIFNSAMVFVSRMVPMFGFLPACFFGFASYFATYFGGFGLHPQNAFDSLWAVVAMNALGVVYAWLQMRFMRVADQHHH